ncbi:class I SAM-dependent methyltransferase [Nonomuraea sediminis]|uniref:class I SAM-dependent methyltransferase n=1 Tax=Nonomuraea sediminis TaxID=2835864 RepID=UPI001BDD9FDB|nr:methyltransferase domain-containing protein [Nonomuraea sediminis]
MTAVYTHGHHESVLRSHRWRTAENSAAYLLPHLKPHMAVLDVGSGPGTITADLADRVGHVTASEVTAEALELAKAAIGDRADVDYAVADVHELPFADDSFCVTHAHQVLQHVGDPVRALREMGRVTKPGGYVAVRDSDYAGFTWWPLLPELDEWLDLYRKVARANGGEPDAGRRLLSWAREAGFEDITPSSSTWCFATPEDRAWWGGMWADRILRSALGEQAVATGLATRGDLERIANGWRDWAAAPDGWISILHGELICRLPR